MAVSGGFIRHFGGFKELHRLSCELHRGFRGVSVRFKGFLEVKRFSEDLGDSVRFQRCFKSFGEEEIPGA